MKTELDAPAKFSCDRLDCFSVIEWNEWVCLAKATRTQLSPCYDCSIKHRDTMTRKGLCEHPETVFVEMKNGDEINPSCGISSLDGKYYRTILLGKPSEKILCIKNQPAFSFMAPFFNQYMAEESGLSS